ncbi:MAG: helix-turn-helix domain-containing protein [Ruminococcus sp.]|nr:helix-turn-helix domain-containing protein [Ruminococcus sp.]
MDNLKILRKKMGLTQEEIAEKLGVSRQAVAKWERGDTMPDIESCIKLADIYGITVDLLVRNAGAEEHTGDGKHIFGCTKMNAKGQITLPANCRKVFGLKEGDNILVLGDEEKGIALVNLGSISGNVSRIKDKIKGED